MNIVSACTLDCPDACSLLIENNSGGDIRIRGNNHHPFTAGFTCKKVRRLPKRLKSPNRVVEPLLKKGSLWHPISWDEALDLCAEKISECRKEPSSILHLHGGANKGISQLAPKLLFARLGASTRRGSLCNNAGVAACIEDFGALDGNDPCDILNCAGIVNWGKDLSRSSVHMAAIVRRARRNGAKVITISPGGDGNRSYSDLVLRIRPGTDRHLAAAVMRLLVRQGGVERSVVKYASNWPVFQSLLEEHPLEELARTCEISLEDITALRDFYSQQGSVGTIIGWGLQRHLFGGENVRFINALAFLSGNIGRSGGGTFYYLPPLRNLNCAWATASDCPPQRSLLLPAIGREIADAVDPPISMVWVNGCNVVNQAPDSKQTARAFEGIGFKVVVDAFMTDTARRADLMLPCALMLEQEDIVASSLHDFVNYARKILDPPGLAKSDLEIVSELGKRLDPPVLIPDLEECFRASLASPILDITLNALREKGFTRAKSRPLAFEGLRFHHPDGRYSFPEALSPEAPSPSDYPLQLLTLIRGDAVHSQILPEDHPPCPTVFVSPENPMLRTIRLDRGVFLASTLGRIRVHVETRPDIHQRVVIYRRGDWMQYGGGANQLIDSKITDLGECAAFYSQHVRLEN